MNKLYASFKKELLLLLRDKVGLVFMFAMPIILVVIITSLQQSAFDVVNKNKIPLLVITHDEDSLASEFTRSLADGGVFEVRWDTSSTEAYEKRLKKSSALALLVLPCGFSGQLTLETDEISSTILSDIGGSGVAQSGNAAVAKDSLGLLFNPALDPPYRASIKQALGGALSGLSSKIIVRKLYSSLGNKKMPHSFEQRILNPSVPFSEMPASGMVENIIPNSTQHNIPAWTVFAIFFIVVSLSSNIVKEKSSGAVMRLKIIPHSYFINLASKQLVYWLVVVSQVVVLFSIGYGVFPRLGLPPLSLNISLPGLIWVTLLSGWCAISYSMCVGVFSKTQEQANGFGAISVVILSAMGGIFIPSFAMPTSFLFAMKCSPLYWCLNSYYGLFLYHSTFTEIIRNSLPLLAFIFAFQGIVILGLKKNRLI